MLAPDLRAPGRIELLYGAVALRQPAVPVVHGRRAEVLAHVAFELVVYLPRDHGRVAPEGARFRLDDFETGRADRLVLIGHVLASAVDHDMALAVDKAALRVTVAQPHGRRRRGRAEDDVYVGRVKPVEDALEEGE